ncbi:MAG TPA: hypothetical protein VEH76_13835 [Methylocystis sp.]|nr:hypothetical protein [Methylocystis sp.]
MKIASPSLLALLLLFPACAPRAETVALSCHVASAEGAQNDLVVEIGNGHVRYGPSGDALVAAQSISGFSEGGETIRFKQNFPATHTVWDWSIDRSSGEITIKYINTLNGKPFLTKRGTCR